MRTRSEAKRERTESRLREFQIDTPNDPINEQVVLAAMIADPGVRARLVKRFSPDAFYADPHKAIASGLALLEERKLDYDPAVVARLHPEVDIRVLETLAASRPDVPPNLDFHVDTLAWDWQRAQFTMGPLAAIVDAIQDPKASPERVRAIARQIGDAFGDADGGARFLRRPDDVVRDMMVALRTRAAGEAHYPYGIAGLDYDELGRRRLRPGAAPGLVTILTGMSGAGKTTLAAHLILNLARQRRRVLVGAWEVRAPMTLELVTTLSLRWSRSRVLDGKTNRPYDADGGAPAMTSAELDEFEARARAISKYVTFVDNPFRRGSVRAQGKVTNDDYLDLLEQHVEASGCDVALFDLFDRCIRYRRPDDEQEALWRLLEMTDRLQIHTIAVHQQLLKGDEVRADKKPSLAGLKGSSAYVDVAAAVLAPHLPARFKDVPDDTMEVYGLKQRFGAPFAIEFDWDPDTGQIAGGRDIPPEASSETSDDVFAPQKVKTRRRR